MLGILDPDPRTFARIRIAAAALYWLSILFTTVGLSYADPAWGKGGIPILILSLPWCIVVLPLAFLISDVRVIANAMATDPGNFFLWGIVCGGLNTVLILGPSKVWDWWKSSLNFRIGLVATVVLLLGSIQLVMPMVRNDARERRRPRNVPKQAAGVGGIWEYWQLCSYDSSVHLNRCQIWNGDGKILQQGEFVASDGGPPAANDELEIVDSGLSGPSRIALRNGRILVPKDRQTEQSQ